MGADRRAGTMRQDAANLGRYQAAVDRALELHKGDAGNGLFIQLTADDERDTPIPDEAGGATSSLTFGALKEAQALGDRRALLDRERRFIRFHLGTDVESGLAKLAEMVS